MVACVGGGVRRPLVRAVNRLAQAAFSNRSGGRAIRSGGPLAVLGECGRSFRPRAASFCATLFHGDGGAFLAKSCSLAGRRSLLTLGARCDRGLAAAVTDEYG